MSATAPTPGEIAAIVQACVEADAASPLEHFPADAAPEVFGADVDGNLAAVAVLAPGRVWQLAVATHPTLRGHGAGVRAAAAALAHVDAAGAPVRTDMWIPGVAARPATDTVAYHLDFALSRRLLRLEVDLGDVAAPQWPPGYVFGPLDDADVDAVVGVNNRAFAWHEDQGTWTVAGLREALDEPWVDRAGFIVARDRGGVAGFCWTKLHSGGAAAGEIFVICTEPAHAGHGLGRALTLAGLAHLAASTRLGMLYVDDANLPARRIYRRLGFHLARVDARYTRDPTMPPIGGLLSDRRSALPPTGDANQAS